ncbi:hypothetical protein [Novosphingobium sp. TH158]|uniref:hypothetical protein n=1 Tax=Novosphingobium sp. TH158 TaxID=2067455 RepID=UPI000C7CF060|nr:hypothetical protein [Novosphingobium sp. TH158]PLK26428.1 hypothetical protein C0V78_05685 [Novosphingobium sp. TH158]
MVASEFDIHFERNVPIKRFVSAVAALALVAPLSVAYAAPDKPLNAATPLNGTECIVRAGEDSPYRFDAACEWHRVVKRDKNGALVFFHYQDKGTLQPGQTAPDRAVKIELVDQTWGGLPCTGSEVITPDGNYASNLKCSN